MERIDWNERADEYDRAFLADPVYRDTLRIIIEQVDLSRAPRVLDLGCGTGAVTRELLDHIPDAIVTGVDPSPRMRGMFSRAFSDSERVRAMEGTGGSIPLADDSCDCVMSNLALHHIPRDEKAACVAEIARVLAPGGTFVYGDHFTDIEAPLRDPARARDLIEKTVGWALYSLEHGAHDYMLGLLRVLPLCIAEEGEYLETPARWQDLLTAASFTDLRILEVPPAEFGMKVLVAKLS